MREVRSSLIRNHVLLADLPDLIEQVARVVRASQEAGRYRLNPVVGQVHHDTLSEALAVAIVALDNAATTAAALAQQLDTSVWALGGIDEGPASSG